MCGITSIKVDRAYMLRATKHFKIVKIEFYGGIVGQGNRIDIELLRHYSIK